jgi:hypothetical protein
MAALAEIKQFIIKTAIISGAIILTFAGLLWIADSYVQDYLGQLQSAIQTTSQVKIGGHQFWSKIEDELDKQADPGSDMPPETKQKLLADIRVLADRWRPFVQAALSVAPKDANEPAKN